MYGDILNLILNIIYGYILINIYGDILKIIYRDILIIIYGDILHSWEILNIIHGVILTEYFLCYVAEYYLTQYYVAES